MANQSDRDGHNFNSNASMQQQNTFNRKSDAGKAKTNSNYKGEKNSDKNGKSGKGGCC